MKRKILFACLTAMTALEVFRCVALSVNAQDSVVDMVAMECVQAIEEHQVECEITLPLVDANRLLDDMFFKYPALYHFFSGGSWLADTEKTMLAVRLKNTEDNYNDIWVIDSDEKLMATIGIGLAELRPEVEFVTSGGYVPTEAAINTVWERLRQNYYLTYMGASSWSSSYFARDEAGVRDYTLSLEYHYDLDANKLQRWRNETEQVVISLADSLFAQDMPEQERVLRIHDWLVNHVRYNNENSEEEGNHLAYGALVKGSCVCGGYAEAGLVLMQTAGINSVYVSGEAVNSTGVTEPHAWNAVEVDGEWYMLDITWDDPITSDGSDILLHDYFLVSSDWLSQNHVWDYSEAPVCNGKKWNADRVLKAVEESSGIYTRYDTSLLVTQEEAKTEFWQVLGFYPVVDVMDGESSGEGDTTPSQPGFQFEESVPSLNEGEKENNDIKEAPPKKNSMLNVVAWLIAGMVVVAGVVFAIVFIHRKKDARRRRNRGIMKVTCFDDLKRL